MSVMDDLIAAVAASTKLDAGAKSVLTSFLTAAAPSLTTLSADAISELMGNFASGDTEAAIAPLAEAMTADQVTAALAATSASLTEEMAVRERQAAAAKAVISALETMALSVLSKAVLAAV